MIIDINVMINSIMYYVQDLHTLLFNPNSQLAL